MTTFESTVEMLRHLPEEDLLAINGLLKRLVSRAEAEAPGRPLSEEAFFDRLAVARKHADEGKVRPAASVIEDLRARYGL